MRSLLCPDKSGRYEQEHDRSAPSLRASLASPRRAGGLARRDRRRRRRAAGDHDDRARAGVGGRGNHPLCDHRRGARDRQETQKGIILAGERHGKPITGFDIGNSPRDFTPAVCKGKTIVMATTNGTPAIVAASEADRVLVAAFVNFSAVCEQLRTDARPVHIVCAGTDAEVSLEDTLLAGAIVDFLCEPEDVSLNDSARLAWDTFENNGAMLDEALELGRGGRNLLGLGYKHDIADAAKVDRYTIAPEVRRDPLRVRPARSGS